MDIMDQPIPTSETTFENDFEKVESVVPGTDDLVSSSTGQDIFSNPTPAPAAPAATAEAAVQPLLSFDDPIPEKRPEPTPAPDSSSAPKAAAPEPVPPPKAKEPVKAQSSTVIDLIYWRDVKKTGIVFGSMLVLLLSLALFSVLSVIAYLSLAGLTVTVSFCVYKKVLGAVQKTGDGHPFKQYLDMDITVPEDKAKQLADHIVKHLSCNLRELRRLFLVEDLVDSLKFGLLLWVLTYIGSWFNGMTLIIVGVVTIFTIPKFYEANKAQIDQYLDVARTQFKNVIKQIQEKIPLPGKKKQQ